ncbi:hypothetical protein BH24ACI3_BH24ACI3_06910 [soil metagenome]
MESGNSTKRDRVRAMVRAVLAKFPEDEPAQGAFTPEHVVVNSLRPKFEQEFDRDESSKSLLTEDDLRGLEPGSRIRVAEGVKLTPLAQDIAAEKNFELLAKQARESSIVVLSVAIGADHGGFEFKEKLKEHLADLGLKIRDFGTNSTDAVDYPDIAHELAKAVGSGHVEAGILIDGAGIGSAMAANKVPGVRAAACYTVALAKNSRQHNGANILTLGSGQSSFDDIREIAEAFLSVEITEDRHKRRVEKIDNIDRQYRR